MSSLASSFARLIGIVCLGFAVGISHQPKSSSDININPSSLLNSITSLISHSTSNLLMTTLISTRATNSTAAILTMADASNIIPFPKDDKRLRKAPKESALSPHHGLHKATLIKKTTVVPEIPGKICPVTTFTFRLDGHPSLQVSDHVQIHLGETIKLYLEDKSQKNVDGTNWTLKSYSPTDVSRPGEIDFTIKLYPDGQNAKLLKALLVGIDHIYVAGPWKRKERLPASHAYLIAFGIGITEISRVANSLIQDGVPTTVVYANRYREDVCFRQEMDKLMRENPLFQVKYMYSRETESLSANEFLGRLDSAQALQDVLGLERNNPDSEEPTSDEPSNASPVRLLAIGSKPMMKHAWECFDELGYPRDEYELLQVL